MSIDVAAPTRLAPSQLYLQIQLGPHTCCLPCNWVEQVVPSVDLTPVPGAPAHVRGLLRYHGQVITVIELGILLGHPPAPAKFSTRIILLRAAPATPGAALGLLAENVLNVLPLAPATFRSPSFGGTVSGPLGGPVAETPTGLIHVLEPARLLPLHLPAGNPFTPTQVPLDPPTES